MKRKFIQLALFLSLFIAPTTIAKFSGIPVRADPPPSPEKVEDDDRFESNDADEPMPDTTVTPEDIETLVSLDRMGERLTRSEEFRLERIAHLFRRIAEGSNRDARRLHEIVRKNRFGKSTRINLSAAILLGDLDRERKVDEDFLMHAKRIATSSSFLLPFLSRALSKKLKRVLNNTPRALLDEVRELRNQLR